MKKLTLLFVLFIVISCSNDDSNGASYSFQFVENSTLIVNTIDDYYMKYGIVEDGDKTVFIYNYVAEDKEEIADDEYSEYIRFEIDCV